MTLGLHIIPTSEEKAQMYLTNRCGGDIASKLALNEDSLSRPLMEDGFVSIFWSNSLEYLQ